MNPLQCLYAIFFIYKINIEDITMMIQIFALIVLILSNTIPLDTQSIPEISLTNYSHNTSYNNSIVDLHYFLINSDVNTTKYNRTTYNCVNFSQDLIYELQDYNFSAIKVRLYRANGSAITDDMHAIIAVNLANKTIFIEPQTDTMLRYDELQSHYKEANFTDVIIYDSYGRSTVLSFNGWMSDKSVERFNISIAEE